jgi:hypothetical protein
MQAPLQREGISWRMDVESPRRRNRENFLATVLREEDVTNTDRQNTRHFQSVSASLHARRPLRAFDATISENKSLPGGNDRNASVPAYG